MGKSRKPRELARSAYDCSHVKSVAAWALLLSGGEHAGKIVANYSDNPAGSVVTLTVSIWGGKLGALDRASGTAGGYGYDKFSAAFVDALKRSNYEALGLDAEHGVPWGMGGAGQAKVKEWLKGLGYDVFEVI